tara:strand:- start:1778 stop:2953 length:1176 start_codon:yes stop_codon:yes gene_type:complete
VACGQSSVESGGTVYQGARLIIGDGSVIENGAFSVNNGQISAVGTSGSISSNGATVVDLSGQTVMPAIVDAHVHMSITREELLNDLRRRAFFGVGAALSMGSDPEGTPLELRYELVPGHARFASAGLGITRPEPGRRMVHWVDSPEQARAAVQTEASRGVDVVKIWVDDRDGLYDKLNPGLYGAVIDEAHSLGVKVSAHIFELDDAKGLVRAGVDILAHGVRDRDIDAEFVILVNDNPDLVMIPNLPGRGVPSDYSWLEGLIPEADYQQLENIESDSQAQSAHAIQARNLARLSQEGMIIGMGTDGNTPWGAHIEMEDMVLAGMSPADVIVAATNNSAAILGLDDMGTIEEGKSADFIVLNANPLDDIKNTRLIDSVYLRGEEVDRGGFVW